MNWTEKISVPGEVMSRLVGEETVILDLVSGTYYGLDPVGARIWDLLVDGRTLGEVCACMLEEFEVSREEIERDVLGLISSLREKNLIAVS